MPGVQGVENLFVVGSLIFFHASGRANPMLKVIALTIPMADRTRKQFK